MKHLNKNTRFSSLGIALTLLLSIPLLSQKSFGYDDDVTATCSCSIDGNAYGAGKTKNIAIREAMAECRGRTREYSYNWSQGTQACSAWARNAIGGALFGCRHSTTQYGEIKGKVEDCW